MKHSAPNAAAKVHPATRESLPDDPMEMHGHEVPGDPDLMLRLLVEEYARIGWGTEAIMRLARDPEYQAFHGLYRLFGEDALGRRVAEIISRCGIIHVETKENVSVSEELVQIKMPM